MPQHALGGHYGAVVDMGWDASGRCLHTVSEDQTSRIFSACRSHWCEIARPQVSNMAKALAQRHAQQVFPHPHRTPLVTCMTPFVTLINSSTPEVSPVHPLRRAL